MSRDFVSCRSYEVTRKDRLFKNIQRMQQIKVVFMAIFVFFAQLLIVIDVYFCVRRQKQ